MWSGAARSTPINDKTDRKKPSAWRTGNRKTRRRVNAVSIAQSRERLRRAWSTGRRRAPRVRGVGQRATASRPLAGPRPARTLTNAPRDTSSCTADGPLISCQDRAPAAVTVAREPTAASSQPKGCAPTPRSLRPLGGRLAPGCAVLLRARGIHREQRLAAALVWWAARLRCDTPDGAARGERKNSWGERSRRPTITSG